MPKNTSKQAALIQAVPDQGEFLLYTAEDGKSVIQVRLHDENLWLSQKQMAELFQVTPPRSISI